MLSGKDTMYRKLPHLRLATEVDCIYLSEHLRKEDIQEIKDRSTVKNSWWRAEFLTIPGPM